MDPVSEFLLIHRFFVGLSIGLVVGCTLGVLIICACFVSADSERRMGIKS